MDGSCRVSWIQSIVVVVAKEKMDLMTDIIQRFQHRKVRVVPGGPTRHRSICNGVLALGEEEEERERPAGGRPKVVIIHDAVRPFVEEDFLHKIALAAKEQGVSMIKAKLTKNIETQIHLSCCCFLSWFGFSCILVISMLCFQQRATVICWWDYCSTTLVAAQPTTSLWFKDMITNLNPSLEQSFTWSFSPLCLHLPFAPTCQWSLQLLSHLVLLAIILYISYL